MSRFSFLQQVDTRLELRVEAHQLFHDTDVIADVEHARHGRRVAPRVPSRKWPLEA
jgi:hypothetical protein